MSKKQEQSLDFTKMETVVSIVKNIGPFVARICTDNTPFPKGELVEISEYSYEDESWKVTHFGASLEYWARVSADDVEIEPAGGFID